MLVLSRTAGDSIKIGDDIEVHILMSERGQIRIGIDAPKSVNIVRSELLLQPHRERPDMRSPKAESSQVIKKSRHTLHRTVRTE